MQLWVWTKLTNHFHTLKLTERMQQSENHLCLENLSLKQNRVRALWFLQRCFYPHFPSSVLNRVSARVGHAMGTSNSADELKNAHPFWAIQACRHPEALSVDRRSWQQGAGRAKTVPGFAIAAAIRLHVCTAATREGLGHPYPPANPKTVGMCRGHVTESRAKREDLKAIWTLTASPCLPCISVSRGWELCWLSVCTVSV